jgi:iron-sulfur cluster insertion protein
MITLTDAAQTRITDLLIDERNPDACLRIYVQGGGCSGFQYGFAFDYTVNEDDFIIEVGSFRVLIDSISAQYLAGSTVDFQDELMESRFVINNPNSSGSCGCGSSFSI